MADRDMTQDPVANQLVGKCFTLNQDAVLVGFGDAPLQILYVPIAGGPLDNPEYMRRVKLHVTDHVPRASTLYVTRLIDRFHGEEVRLWDVYAQLHKPNGESIEALVAASELHQSWLVEWRSRVTGDRPQFANTYVRPCGAVAP